MNQSHPESLAWRETRLILGAADAGRNCGQKQPAPHKKTKATSPQGDAPTGAGGTSVGALARRSRVIRKPGLRWERGGA